MECEQNGGTRHGGMAGKAWNSVVPFVLAGSLLAFETAFRRLFGGMKYVPGRDGLVNWNWSVKVHLRVLVQRITEMAWKDVDILGSDI